MSRKIKHCLFADGVTGRVISPDDNAHYFFGYYDLQPYSEDGKKHLAHRVAFANKIPNETDKAELGYIENGKFIKVAETTAWNFQQGALLQWFDKENILYNYRDEQGFCSIIKNIYTQEERRLPLPLANVSLDRKWGLSINFGRIYDYRAGYGYAGYMDKGKSVNAPENDGVFLIDMQTGNSKLILSYKQIRDRFLPEYFKDSKILINHITFNPSANRFLMLVRTFKISQDGQLTTMLLTSDRGGKDVRKLTDFEVNSHYYWKNDEEFIIWSNLKDGAGLYFINDRTGEVQKSADRMLNESDFHCSYTPDQKMIIGDTYVRFYYDSFYRYDVEKKTTEQFCHIKRTNYEYNPPHDARCDNHIRCNQTGEKLSFDAFTDEYRQICELEGFNSYLK